MYAEQKFFVGVQDCGTGGLINNRALIEYMSDTANVHGIMVGQTIESLKEKNLAWVISGWKLAVTRRVKHASTVTVRTWSGKYNQAFANREFLVFDENGDVIAKATSVWMVIDTLRNFPHRLTPEIIDPFLSEPENANFPDFKFENPAFLKLETLSSVNFTVNKSMIDYNNHVHNSAYLDIANEALPEDACDTDLNNVEIIYKREIKPAQRLKLNYAKQGDEHYILIYNEDESVLHSVIKLYA